MEEGSGEGEEKNRIGDLERAPNKAGWPQSVEPLGGT